MTNTTPFQSRLVLQVLADHPGTMSPVLLDHFLRGEVLGRMADKGLLESPYFGALSTLPSIAVAALIDGCQQVGWLTRAEGFYPALSLTTKGEEALDSYGPNRSEASPETNYKAYYRWPDRSDTLMVGQGTSPDRPYQEYYKWRRATARLYRKAPYRIFPNAVINQLAIRCPTTLGDLLKVPGIGTRRALRYQDELLRIGVFLGLEAATAAKRFTRT